MWEKLGGVVAVAVAVAAVVAGYYDLRNNVGEGVKKRIGAAEEKLVTDLGKRIGAAEEKLVTDLGKRIGAAEEKLVTDLGKRIGAAEEKLVTDLGKRIKAAEEKLVTDLGKRIGAAEEKLSEMAGLKRQVGAIAKGCSEVEKKSLGGNKGNPFAAVVPSMIQMRAGDTVDALILDNFRYGGTGGHRTASLSLEPDEYIDGMTIWHGKVVNRLVFRTNKGKTLEGGRRVGEKTDLVDVRVLKIGGHSGRLFDRIDLIYCARQ